MRRRTVAHDRCTPFVVRQADRIEIHVPVIRPDGKGDALVYVIEPTDAAFVASELLAAVAQHLVVEKRKGRRCGTGHQSVGDVASERA